MTHDATMKRRRHVRPPDLPGDPEADRPLSQRSRLRLKVGDDEDGLRLDRFLAKRCTWRSRTKIEELIESDQVELAGRVARPSRKVHAGETIVVKLPRPKREVDLRARGGLPELPILHEDAELLAVDKPAGIPVHPGGRLLEDTVITRLRERFAAAAKRAPGGGDDEASDAPIVPKLCHRLDLETSGVLLVAKSDAVAAEMGRQMRRRETIKEYQAIVHGIVADDDFVVDAPLGDHPASRVGNRRGVVPGGSPAKTGVTVERRFRRDGGGYTLVRCRLFTGRRHQIRVHLHHAGFPIVGDKVYGLSEEYFLAYYEGRLDAAQLRELILPRQALHAARLVVSHPKRKTPLEIVAPLAADLAAFLASLEPQEERKIAPS